MLRTTILLILFSTFCFSEEQIPVTLTSFDKVLLSKHVNDYAKQYGFSGEISIKRNEQVIWQYQHLYQVNPKVEQTNVLPIGSISKPVHTMYLSHLAHQGSIDLNKPLIDYLPTLNEPFAIETNINDLLRHTSGLPGVWTQTKLLEEFGSSANFSERNLKFIDYINALEKQPKSQRKATYSNIGIILSAVIAEQVMGESYPRQINRFMREHLFMRNSGHYQENTFPESLYIWPGFMIINNDKVSQSYQRLENFIGAGSLYSSSNDLHQLMNIFGQTDKNKTNDYLFSLESAEKLGWHVDNIKRKGQLAHRIYFDGSTKGTSVAIMALPELAVSIVVTSNIGRQPVNQLVDTLSKVFLM